MEADHQRTTHRSHEEIAHPLPTRVENQVASDIKSSGGNGWATGSERVILPMDATDRTEVFNVLNAYDSLLQQVWTAQMQPVPSSKVRRVQL